MINSTQTNKSIYSEIDNAIRIAISMFGTIPIQRKLLLQELSDYIYLKINEHKKIELTFICTHNSRRSHFAQIWAQTAAAYYGIDNVYCYSGGTEVTGFNINAVKALEQTGFVIDPITQGTNPHYEVKFNVNGPAIHAYSKKYGDAPNPTKEYGAILTCSQADVSCPIVYGAEARFKVSYEDPKLSDGTNDQEKVYAERSFQIASEMCYVFSLLIK